MAETKQNAEAVFDLFVKTYEDKYPGTVQCLLKDQDELLAFYDSLRLTGRAYAPHKSHRVSVRHY